MKATELSHIEYKWWEDRTSEFLGKKVSGIQLYKDEVGYMGQYYKKSDIIEMDTSKVTRIEVIDHTKKELGGRVYTFWSEYRKEDIPNPKVELYLQDDGRTLKVFIK